MGRKPGRRGERRHWCPVKSLIMDSQTFHIRRAVPDDAGRIADIGLRTFEASFGADNHPDDMALYLSKHFSKTHIAA